MPAFLGLIFRNDVLLVAVIASTLAQFLKPFTYFLRDKQFDWRYIAATGGMPSSHSAMVSALACGVGIVEGFDSSYFAIAVVLAAIVTYDAAGVRRQTGENTRAINLIIAEALSGSRVSSLRLKEAIGHSRQEVFGGILFGIAVMLIWKFVIQPQFTG